MRHLSFNAYHLGDNLVHLHFLRALAGRYPDREFRHAVHACHLPQLNEVVADRENLTLVNLDEAAAESYTGWRDVWKNAGGFWERHARRDSFLHFHLNWFAHLANEMGLPSPLQRAEDFLFDYPALRSSLGGFRGRAFDFLIVNSQPSSGQLKGFDSVWYFEPLIADLKYKGHSVVVTNPTHVPDVPCTRDYDLTLSGIGHLSHYCRHHIMVATGPMWPTLNAFNREVVETRIVLLDHVLGPEYLDLLPISANGEKGTLAQVATLAAVRAVLRGKGLL